ncbi:hypothetical protein [Streptomyces sviceus]|uniref:hypothetical protein n=1 Tax=Streptomyces sviceus TaxID=285530 RepID=UPI0036C6711E
MERTDKHEFRVVLDGIELSDQQKRRISAAVQKAALGALAQADVRLGDALVLGHSGPRLRPEWLGIWVIDGSRAAELGPALERQLFRDG